MDARQGSQLRLLHLLTQIVKTSILFGALITAIFYLNQINFAEYFPITKVKVFGVEHISEKEVQEIIQPLVKRGFFNINIERVREHLLHIPWVADVYVRRLWPSQVEITIVEKNALANWNDQALLSQNGEIFTPEAATFPVHLPKLIGPDGEQMIMLKFFTEMNRLFVPLHAKISYLELTPFRTWKLTLDNGITMLMGHKDVLTRLAHFVKVYPKIIGSNAEDVESVDLRYPNGVAVRWKTPIRT